MSRAQPRAPRWPDLLIGLLVLLLLAGFAALLLSQRPAPVAQVPPVTEAPPTIVIPGAPGTDLDTTDPGTVEDPAVTPAPAPGNTPAPEAQAPATQETPTPPAETPAPETPATEASAPEAPASQSTPAGQPPATGPPTAAAPTPQPPANPPQSETPQPAPPASTTPDAAAVIPADPIPAAPPPPPAPAVTLPRPPTTPPSAAPSTPAAVPPGRSASTPPAAPPRSGSAVATSEQRTPLRSDYRISLGTFGGESGAQQAAQGVRSLGYTVYSIDLGEQVVAQIGPFADEATARRALADIQRAYPRAVLYPPRGRNLTGGGVSESASAAPTPAPPEPEATPAEPEAPPAASSPATSSPASTPEPEAATERAPAPSGPVYLQVGAFDRTESAQRLVGLLREEGYAPTVNAPEGRKVTVLIGPFTGDALTRAEDDLDAGGFDHFRVR